MKKEVFILVLLSLITRILFADEQEDFKRIIEKNTGYYYCEKENKIVHLSISEENYLVTKIISFNFNTNTMRNSAVGSVNIFYNDRYFYKTKACFEIEGDAILSYNYLSDVYVPIKYTTDEELIRYMKENTVRKFACIIGNYYDATLRKTFSISKAKDTFKLVVISDNGKKEEDTLELDSTWEASGSVYKMSFFNNELSFYVYEDIDEYSYNPTFKIEEVSKGETDKNINVELYQTSYTFGEDKHKLTVSKDKVIITHGSGWADDYGYDLYSLKVKIFMDEFGYKHVESEGEKFIIIDGEEQNITFNYHGDSLKDDTESVNKVFKTYPTTWTQINYAGRYHNINGGYFDNVKASSTLKDKYHEYVPEGTMKVFNPSENPRFWVKDNIPWVEGKADDGIGESIEFDIIPTDWRAVVGIDLRILNGYVDPLRPHLFYENNRIKRALIETDTGFTTEIQFNDAIEFTSVKLPKETQHVKLTIEEVYSGTKYRDTCITAFDMYYDLWNK
ncbi:NADase-type glycan-binding domain-containing protein [Sediminispirochaeta smaragdinae]|nr:hypothetical protein [Sediminispirochaeta smaragdinae]